MKRYCTNCKKFFSIPNRMEGVVCKCPMCGHVEESLPDNDMFLKAETVLKDRYTVGKYIKCSETSITYRAWDKEQDTLVAVIEYYPKGIAERVEGLKVAAKCNTEPGRSNEIEDRTEVEIKAEKNADIDIKKEETNEFIDGKMRFLEEAHKLAKNDSEDNSKDNSKDENVLVQDIFEENGTAYIVLNIL